jgi:hypothetical protein
LGGGDWVADWDGEGTKTHKTHLLSLAKHFDGTMCRCFRALGESRGH